MSGGPALKRAIHLARARTDMTTDVQLVERAGVSYDTLMNWFGSRTVPRPAELKKVADALEVSYGDLMAVYEGRDPEPPSLQDVVRLLTLEIQNLVTEMRLERERDQDAAAAMMKAAKELARALRPPRFPGSTAPPVPDGTKG